MATKEPDFQERLREGIEAARRGDRINARRLLQQVLIIDRDNEVALMWMASVVDSMAERRAFLERALRVNPNNDRAREALKRMGVNVAAAPAGGARGGTGGPARTAPARGGTGAGGGTSRNSYLIAAGSVAVLTIVVVIVALLSQRGPTLTQEQIAQQTLNALMNPTLPPTNIPANQVAQVAPTETRFFGVIVTLDPNAQYTLPPTFTPTDTPLPSVTPSPTATDVPASSYQLLFTAFADGSPYPGLYRVNANGRNEETLGNPADGYYDAAYSASGDQIAFVRPVTPSGSDAPPVPQLFVGPLADLTQVSQITTLTSPTLNSPAWAPDNSKIVFVTAEDGDADLWIYDFGSSQARPLTSNTAQDNTPSWSPDGETIVFSSDMDSPGFSEIYAINVRTEVITRLSDEGGQNYQPVYSPDGSRIAFVSTQSGDGDVYIMDADGQRKFLLTVDDGSAEDRTPRFTPDGAYIGFVSNRDGEFSPYLLNLRNNVVTRILESSTEVQSISINPSVR